MTIRTVGRNDRRGTRRKTAVQGGTIVLRRWTLFSSRHDVMMMVILLVLLLISFESGATPAVLQEVVLSKYR